MEQVERLFGNTLRESRDLADAYIRMTLLTDKIQIKKLKYKKPYMPKLMQPSKDVESQVRRHPSLTDKLFNIENLVQSNIFQDSVNNMIDERLSLPYI